MKKARVFTQAFFDSFFDNSALACKKPLHAHHLFIVISISCSHSSFVFFTMQILHIEIEKASLC